MKITIAIIVFVILLIIGINTFDIRISSKETNVILQNGYELEVFAENLGKTNIVYPGPNTGPRILNFWNGVLYASIPNQGRVVALPDLDGDGKADQIITVVDGLNRPHGFDFHDNKIYVAEENAVRKFQLQGNVVEGDGDLLFDLPEGGHWTRTLKIQDNSIYVSIGSSCDVCYEDDERRASIIKCSLDGDCSVFAKGLRNSVGFVFNDGKLYATDNGRDNLGDDIPPEEINLVEEGKDYGWPICYGDRVHDTNFDKNVYVRNPCEDTVAPIVEMQAHSAPLGLAFYEDDLLVAFHGSWNRNEPTGYKVVRINLQTRQVSDFVSGWLRDGSVSGRPVDVLVVNDDIYISDDNAGKIYRVFRN